jgi:Fe-S cluster biogenesis protein NfuA
VTPEKGEDWKRRQVMREKIEAALSRIRPVLQADGGDVELVDVSDGVVKLRLTGACDGCAMATLTLRVGIERVLKEQVPEVKEVVAV